MTYKKLTLKYSDIVQ